MLVTIDASQLTGQSAHSGIGSYVRGLLAGLAGRPDVTVRALATDDAGLPAGVGRQRVVRHFRTGRPAIYEHELRRHVELHVGRPRGVFHNPNPHAPLLPPRPWVQTLFDLIPLHSDEPVDAAFRRRFERFGPRYARADEVIAISRHVADEGMARLGIPASRLEVVHLGIGPEFTPGPGPRADPPYLLVVCEYSRRKGIREAVGIVDLLADAGLPHHLRIAGRVPPWVADDLRQVLRSSRHPGRIHALGFVDDLPSLYRGADAVLVTSRDEGFGLPAAEAMACGTPVVSFANTALTEVVADGGALVADGDVEAFAAAVRRLLEDPAAHEDAVGRALARAGAFDWKVAAARTAEVYRRAGS